MSIDEAAHLRITTRPEVLNPVKELVIPECVDCVVASGHDLAAWLEEHAKDSGAIPSQGRPWDRQLLETTLIEAVGDAGPVLVGTREGQRRTAPADLFLREFLRLDGSDALCAFVKEWGPLSLPARLVDEVQFVIHAADLVADDSHHWVAITSKLRLPQAAPTWVGGRLVRTFSTEESSLHPFFLTVWPVRQQEILASIYQAVFWTTLLQLAAPDTESDADVTGQVQAVWRDHQLPVPRTMAAALRTAALFVNAGAAVAAPRLEPLGPDGESIAVDHSDPDVLSLLCLQLLSHISNGLPMRQCQHETCGRWFNLQEGRARKGLRRTTGDVLYCEASCARAAAQAQYRRRQREKRLG